MRQTCRLLSVLGGSSLRHQIRIQMKALRAEQAERSGCGLDKGLASSGTLRRQSSGYHIISWGLIQYTCRTHYKISV